MSTKPIGRPPIGPEVKTRITEKDMDTLEARAAVLGIDRSEAIRRAIQYWLAETPTAEIRTWRVVPSRIAHCSAISGRTLREAIESCFRSLMGPGGYRLVRVTAQIGQGTIGHQTYATVTVIYHQHTRLEQYSREESIKTFDIYADVADLPQPIEIEIRPEGVTMS